MTSANQAFDERFIIEDRLPRQGGSALVYKARDTADDFKPVALKVFHQRESQRPGLINKLFGAELGALERLEHPNIVRLVAWNTEPERYVALEWLPKDLYDVKLDSGPYPDWTTFWTQVGRPVLQALAWAHSQYQLIHRDVSPGNVLLDDHGEPKLADFGLSKVASILPSRPLTVADQKTLPFSPANDDPFGEFAATRDVYSFAAVAVYMLTDIEPFQEHEHLERAAAVLSAPQEVAEVLRCCLAQDPGARPATVGVLLDRLERLAEDTGLKEPPLPLFIEIGPCLGALAEENRTTLEGVRTMLEADLRDGVALEPYVDRHGAKRDGQFQAYGERFSYHLKVDDATGAYVVALGATLLPATVLERLRGAACELPVRITFGRPQARAAVSRVLDIVSLKVLEHEARRGAEIPEQEAAHLFGKWGRVLDLHMQRQRRLRTGVRFTNRRADGGQVTLQVDASGGLPFPGEQVLLSDEHGRRLMRGEVIETGDASVAVARTSGLEASELPQAGTVGLDTTPSDRSIERQQAALKAAETRASLRRDLRDIVADPTLARPPTPQEALVAKGLDREQTELLARALNSEDIVAIAGPPGTGKTTFIAHLVAQELSRRPSARVLIASQTNVAVDNAMERIAAVHEGHTGELRMLRIGARAASKVRTESSAWLLEAQLRAWREQVVARSRSFVDDEARRCGLDVRALHTAMDLDELADVQEAIGRTGTRVAGLEARLMARTVDAAGADGVDVVARLANTRQRTAQAEEERELESELAGVREERDVLRGDRRAIIDRLVARRNAPARSRLEQAGTHELRAMADDVLRDGPPEAIAGLKRLVRLQAEWAARFGNGEEFTAALIRRANVVGATCIGLAGVRGYEDAQFDLCILDEASRATPPEALVPMVKARRWVLVGDERQLPPFVDQALRERSLLEEVGLEQGALRETLFARMRELLPQGNRGMLRTQYRMEPEIGSLISSCFYGGELVNGRDRERLLPTSLFPSAVVWQSTVGLGTERREVRRGTSFANPGEARVIAATLERLSYLYPRVDGRRPPLRVGVLSGYMAQVETIRTELQAKQASWTNLDIEVNTVDAVQGREFAVVCYSVTRSNGERREGHLADERRINVALSRAEWQLVIVGDDGFVNGLSESALKRVLRHIHDRPDECAIVDATA